MAQQSADSTLDEGTQLLFAEGLHSRSIALPVAVLSTEIPLWFLADALDLIVEDTVTKALNCGPEWVFPELNNSLLYVGQRSQHGEKLPCL